MAQVSRRLDGDERAAEDQDVAVIGQPLLRLSRRRQVPDGKDPSAGGGQDPRQVGDSAVGEDEPVVGERFPVFEHETPLLAIEGLDPDAPKDHQVRVNPAGREEEVLFGDSPRDELGQERPVITGFLFRVDQRHGPIRPGGPAGRGGLKTGGAAANNDACHETSSSKNFAIPGVSVRTG